MREPEPYTISLDIDKNRIRDVLKETYTICQEILKVDFYVTQDEFVSKIDPFLESNRISTAVSLGLPSHRYPEMLIEVNVRKRGVIARMNDKNKRIYLNRILTNL